METIKRTAAELTDRMDLFHAWVNANLAHLLEMVVEYDLRELWRSDGASSMATWLCFQYGLTPRTGRDWVEVAHALVELPALKTEFVEGRLSFEQVKYACRLATPETDGEWAEEARKHSATRLEAMARRKRVIEAAESNDLHRQRSHRMRWDSDHRFLHYTGQLPGEEGAIFEAAIGRLVDKMGPNPSTGCFDDYEVRASDAMVQLASQSLGADGDPDRATVVVHVTAEALKTGHGSGEVEGGPGLCIDTVRRLACDGRVEVVAENGDRVVVGIGRARRTIPGWLWRSLRHRDRGCRFPGCDNRRWVHGHHIRYWSEGGETDLPNLITLCPRHHRMLHEEGWRIEGDPNGEVTWIKPDGRVFAARAGPCG